jgi:hypothetical protein
VQHDRGVLADGVEHDGAVKLSGDFSDYMDALSLKLLEVGLSQSIRFVGCLRFDQCVHERIPFP